jgi:hypothetical protein
VHRTKKRSLKSESGQQRSSNDVCVTSTITPTAAQKQTFPDFAFVPLADSCSAAKKASLLDHFVSAGEYRGRYSQAERFGGFEVDH